MILEVKKWPESQEVMNKQGWFFITGSDYFDKDGEEEDLIGDAAYARVLDESEYILVEKTTADEVNNEFDDEDTWKETEEFISHRDRKAIYESIYQRDYGPPYGPHNPTGNEKPPNCS
jgi:hypothetical protein